MNVKFRKKDKSVLAVYAILLIVYVIGFLIIPINKAVASWICFAFTVIAIVNSLLVFKFAFNSKETLVSKIYGYPIFRVGTIYAFTQLVFSIAIWLIGAVVAVPYWIALFFSVILLAAAIIGEIITDNTRDFLEHMDESVKVDTECNTRFQISIAGILDSCEDGTLKPELEKLNEEFRFSDPVSNSYTKEAEEKIGVLLVELKEYVENNNSAEASVYIKKISNGLAERNRICKATKTN